MALRAKRRLYKMPRQSNKAEAKALKTPLKRSGKRMKTLIQNLGKAVTDK
jgi:hypothetical protein